MFVVSCHKRLLFVLLRALYSTFKREEIMENVGCSCLFLSFFSSSIVLLRFVVYYCLCNGKKTFRNNKNKKNLYNTAYFVLIHVRSDSKLSFIKICIKIFLFFLTAKTYKTFLLSIVWVVF